MGGLDVTDHGSVGTDSLTEPDLAASFADPWWHNPFNRAVGMKNSGADGPQPEIAGIATGGVPTIIITIILNEFGQAGGAVSIF